MFARPFPRQTERTLAHAAHALGQSVRSRRRRAFGSARRTALYTLLYAARRCRCSVFWSLRFCMVSLASLPLEKGNDKLSPPLPLLPALSGVKSETKRACQLCRRVLLRESGEQVLHLLY